MTRLFCFVLLATSLTAMAKPADDQTREDQRDEDILVDPDDEADDLDFEDAPTTSTKKSDGDQLRFDEIDDDEMEDFTDMAPLPAPKARARPTPKRVTQAVRGGVEELDITGKRPLGGGFEARIVETGEDTVVVELPVLLATSPDGVEDTWIIADMLIDGRKVSEVRILMTKAGMSVFGPTFGFLKAQVPVTNPTGDIEIIVVKKDKNSNKGTELFRTKAAYALK